MDMPGGMTIRPNGQARASRMRLAGSQGWMPRTGSEVGTAQ
jgi:hypothetical protein